MPGQSTTSGNSPEELVLDLTELSLHNIKFEEKGINWAGTPPFLGMGWQL